MAFANPTLLRLAPTDKGLEILFGGASDDFVAGLIGNFFNGRGFVLGSGSPIAGVYETGSAVGRAVLGGFVKRQKYSVNVWTDEHGTHARVHSEMSGASGSIVGVVRERKGRDEVKSALQWYLQSTMSQGSGSQQYSPQPGFGSPTPYAPQSYPQQSLPQTGAPPAPYVVPPPIHPQHRASAPASGASGNEQQTSVGNVSVELARLGALHRAGQMSDADFEAAKRRLLGR